MQPLQNLPTSTLPSNKDRKYYDWKQHYSKSNGSCLKFVRWLVNGISTKKVKQTSEELEVNLSALARMLMLLRQYEIRFGIPQFGGPVDQERILRIVTEKLYVGGAPIWALESILQGVAEGLTGQQGVNFLLLPRKALIFAPNSNATTMFPINRGFDISTLDHVEPVAVRLASFACNTRGINNILSRRPHINELRAAVEMSNSQLIDTDADAESLGKEILDLASEAEGLFFFVNSGQVQKVFNEASAHNGDDTLRVFWTVSEAAKDIFSRLACLEALTAMKKIEFQLSSKVTYSKLAIAFFRIVSSGGACAIWFNGSWYDMIVAAGNALAVAWIAESSVLSRQERIIFEVLASILVGVVAGVVNLQWPDETCFGAMALGGILDILQGFRVIYAVIELMSKHTVTGGADLIEGILFTSLIAFFLKFGQYLAAVIMGEPSTTFIFAPCSGGIDQLWYFLFVPLAALGWSGLFNPRYGDLLPMTLHGVLAFAVSWLLERANKDTVFSSFFAAAAVTTSAGLVSRFTGRQAIGNTVAGLYVILPGAYMVKELQNIDAAESFLSAIVLQAIIIGIGAWTGTILCSPTLLGTTKGLLQQSAHRSTAIDAGRGDNPPPRTALIFF